MRGNLFKCNISPHEPQLQATCSSSSTVRIRIRSITVFLTEVRFQGNNAYLLQTECGYVPVYCQMTKSGMGACGGGGWTLVMKIDGQKVCPLPRAIKKRKLLPQVSLLQGRSDHIRTYVHFSGYLNKKFCYKRITLPTFRPLLPRNVNF